MLVWISLSYFKCYNIKIRLWEVWKSGRKEYLGEILEELLKENTEQLGENHHEREKRGLKEKVGWWKQWTGISGLYTTHESQLFKFL